MGVIAQDSSLHLPESPPDSIYVRQADELAEEVYDTDFLNHCLRCWYFAHLFAQIEHQRYDPELLYIACLLHDMALSETYRPTSQDPPCFAVHGGNLAAQTLRKWGADDQSAHTVGEAIARHMNAAVPVGEGSEAHLLHAAAHLDVAGAQVHKISRSLIKQVDTRYPRGQFTTKFIEVMRREAHDYPDSRTAVLWKLGMQLLIRINPIEAFAFSPPT